MHRLITLALGIAICGSATAAGATIVLSSTGATTADITPTVNVFRADLGTLNANVAGSFGSGRREINWDGVPDAFSAPNLLPPNFFNVNSPRGVTFGTPGTGFEVSANASNPTSTPVQFGDINAIYPQIFEPFSAQRLFTAIGSNIVDVNFFIPGTTIPGQTNGFGAVFSDVDLADTTSLTFFDINGNLLGSWFVPNIAGDQTFSFLGVIFDDPIISRVRITNGNAALASSTSETGNIDLVTMDDFIFGEPISAPEPDSWAMLLLGFAVVGTRIRRRRLHAAMRSVAATAH